MKKIKDLTIQEVFDELKKGKKITWGEGISNKYEKMRKALKGE